jgi:hypothetical protein
VLTCWHASCGSYVLACHIHASEILAWLPSVHTSHN